MLTCHICGREGSRGFVPLGDGFHQCINTDQCAKRVAKAERARLADRCVDCLQSGDDPKGQRKLALKDDGSRQPGPRCVTHWRARRKDVSAAAHERRLDQNFELTAEQYQALYDSQGGKCFICRKSTGKTKRLAVEHDHTLAAEHGHDPDKGCPRCIRCLSCGRCNKLIAFLDVEALQRAIVVLTDPPARKILLGDDWPTRLANASAEATPASPGSATSDGVGVIETDGLMRITPDPSIEESGVDDTVTWDDLADASAADLGDFWKTSNEIPTSWWLSDADV